MLTMMQFKLVISVKRYILRYKTKKGHFKKYTTSKFKVVLLDMVIKYSNINILIKLIFICSTSY